MIKRTFAVLAMVFAMSATSSIVVLDDPLPCCGLWSCPPSCDQGGH